MDVKKGLFLMMLWATIASAIAVGQDLPAGVRIIPPEGMRWILNPTNGLESASLLGDSTKPGPYLQLVKWPPNKRLPAHKHPDDRYGMVISGVHYVGYGDKFDEAKLHAHSPGTYFTEPANTPHFGMTKGEGAVLYFYGVGPSGSTPLE